MQSGIERAKICKMARSRPNDFRFGMSRECTMPIQNSIGPNTHAGKRLTFSKIQVRSVSVLRFIMHDWCFATKRYTYALFKGMSHIYRHGPRLFRPHDEFFSQMPKWCRNITLYKATLKNESWNAVGYPAYAWWWLTKELAVFGQEYDSFIALECCYRVFPSLSEVWLNHNCVAPRLYFCFLFFVLSPFSFWCDDHIISYIICPEGSHGKFRCHLVISYSVIFSPRRFIYQG